MTHDDKLFNLRMEFQSRIAVHCLELWTISNEEAEALMRLASVPILLSAFTSAGKWLRQQRERLYFHSQEVVLQKLNFLIQREKENKLRDVERRRKTRVKDYMNSAPVEAKQ